MYESKNPERTYGKAIKAIWLSTGLARAELYGHFGEYSPESAEKVSAVMDHLAEVDLYRQPAMLAKIIAEAAETALLMGLETPGETPKTDLYIRIDAPDLSLDNLTEVPFVYKVSDFAKLPGAIRRDKSGDSPAYVELRPSGLEAMESDEAALAYVRQFRDVLISYGVNALAKRRAA